MLFTLQRPVLVGVVFFLAAFQNSLAQEKPGDLFPSWTEGTLDIHHINTGKGESSLFLMPDGTTLLVDAGATNRPKPRVTDPRPNGTRTPGDWISRYVEHMLKDVPEAKLDYLLLTHFHDDHMGSITDDTKKSSNGAYQLAGITEVGDRIPFSKLIDRNWPDYNWPIAGESPTMKNYRNFVDWQVKNRKVVAEQFRVGSKDQVKLLREPANYPDFEIRNIAANGHVWTGVGDQSRNHFPALEHLNPSEYPNENMISSAFRLSYGKFDYFNGADITSHHSRDWRDIETPVGYVTGPVEVCLANHHAHYDAMGDAFVRSVRPRVHIILSWSPSHPATHVLARMLSKNVYPGPRDVFMTNTMPETVIVAGSRIEEMKSGQGHIVIRVAKGGGSFRIFILDDSEESFRIKSVHGPYICD
jgi:beta-lactamase superfamily II metal-dependent hydrolase